MGQVIVRGRLRARLLVGVAAAAIAAPVTGRGLAADPGAKWSPYVEAGGMVGSTHSFGDVDIFLPVWQDQTSLLFGDLRGTFSTEPTEEGNFGLGYRTQLNTDWILGGYGYFDIQNSQNDNLFYQVTLGVELKSVDWDFRLNGYIPLNPDGGIVDNKTKASIQITGNNIQLNSSTRKEKALYGFDGEVGWRLPFFPVDGDFDIRAFVGGYYFANSDVDTIAGPRGRIEARLYDIDFLGLQSRLTAQGVIQWDQPRGTQGFGGLELRIPLGAVIGSPGPKLNPLDRRMVDRVQRDVDIVSGLSTPDKQSEDVIVDELTVSTHTIVFANGPGGGSGVQGSPTDLKGAPALAPGLNGGTGSNAIILADGAGGTINLTNPLQLLPGQALIGGGSTVRLTGVDTHLHVNFLFPGSQPTLSGTSTANLIEMASGSQNEIFGLNLAGPFSNGIFGADMERAIIKENTIASAGANGILLVDDPAPSEFIHISGNTISNAADDGIKIDTAINSAAVFSQTVLIEGNTITSAGLHGIALYTTGGSGTLSQNFAILDNVVDHTGRDGILVFNSVVGATLAQNGSIAGNQVSDTPDNGILVENFAVSAGTHFSQALAIDGNTIASAGRNGIDVFSTVEDVPAGGVSQAVAIDGNWISHVALNGIFFDAEVDAFGGIASLTQTFAIDNNVISDTGENGILDQARLFSTVGVPAALAQTGEINGNTVTSTGVNGIAVYTRASAGLVPGSSLSQALNIDNNTISHIHQSVSIDDNTIEPFDSLSFAGIHVQTDLYNLSHATQAITIDPNIISSVTSGNGIVVFTSLSNSTLSQSLDIAANTISGVESFGIVVGNVLTDFSSDGVPTSLSQAFTIAGNSVSGGSFGIVVFNQLDTDPVGTVGTALLTQTGVIDGNAVDGASSVGIGVATDATGAGTAFSQNVSVTGNSVTNIGDELDVGTGIALYTKLYQGAGGTQNLVIAGNIVSAVGRDGIFLSNRVIALGNSDTTTLLTQTATITGNQVTGAGEIGIHVDNYVSAARRFIDPDMTAGLVQNLTIAGNTVTSSGVDGVLVANNVFADGEYGSVFLIQSVSIDGNRISDSGEHGILVATDVEATYRGSANLSQSVAINDNTVSGSTADGIFVSTFASGYYNASGGHSNGIVSFTQAVTIDPNTVTDSGADGIAVKTVIYTLDSAVQTVTVADNSVSGARGNGIAVQTSVYGATLTQTLNVLGNAITSSGLDGIFVENHVFADGEGGNTFLSQLAAIDGNRISDSGENGIEVANYVRAASFDAVATLSQSVAIDGNQITSSGANGVAVANEVRASFFGAVATLSQSVGINDNTIASSILDGIFVSTFANAYGGSDPNGTINLTQALTIDPNTVTGSGGDGIAVKTALRYVASAVQVIHIADNSIAGSGRNGVYVGTVLSNADLAQTLSIANNSITLSGSNGILVDNDVFASSNSHALTQTGAIVGNRITSSGLNGIFLSNHVSSVPGEGSGTYATIGQTLAIAFNTIDGVQSAHVTGATGSTPLTRDGGNGILVQNNVGTYGALNQSLGISGNVITNVRSFDGVYIKTTADRGGTATQSFTIAGNHAFNNGGYGIAIKAVVKGDVASLPGGTISQSMAITNNTLDHNLYGALGIFVIASHGTVTQGGTIALNILTNATAHYGEGIDAAALAGSQGVVSQTFAVNNNTIGGNAVGVYLRAGDKVLPSDFQTLIGGLVNQVWSFTGNAITGNNANFASGGISKGGNGLYALVSGSNATQLITLVTGNVISGNSSDGVRLVDFGAQQTATLHSNLTPGPFLNTITANGAQLFYSSAGGTQVVHK